jgi:hypothetical protein
VECNNEETIISYLLCRLCEDEQTYFEQQYFSDDGLFQRLLVVEDLLIKRYVEQELSKEDLLAFESYFLRSPGRLVRVERAKAMIRDRPNQYMPPPGRPGLCLPDSWWGRLIGRRRLKQ